MGDFMNSDNLILSQEEAEQMQKEDMKFVTDLYGSAAVNKLIANAQSRANIIDDAMNKHIVQIRKSKKMSQIELAKKAGISVNSIRLYEAGKRSPTFATLQKIADALGVSWYELVSDVPEEQAEAIKTHMVEKIAALGISSNEEKTFLIRETISNYYDRLNIDGKLAAYKILFERSDDEVLADSIQDFKALVDTPQYQKKAEE